MAAEGCGVSTRTKGHQTQLTSSPRPAGVRVSRKAWVENQHLSNKELIAKGIPARMVRRLRAKYRAERERFDALYALMESESGAWPRCPCEWGDAVSPAFTDHGTAVAVCCIHCDHSTDFIELRSESDLVAIATAWAEVCASEEGK
jgi:hypothetical protein